MRLVHLKRLNIHSLTEIHTVGQLMQRRFNGIKQFVLVVLTSDQAALTKFS